MAERTVSEVLVDQLAALEHVFGLLGTSCLGVVDAIRKHGTVRFIETDPGRF